MISVEQVRALEERVEKAVAYIAALKSENAALRRDLEIARSGAAKAATRIGELEAAAEAYRHEQAGIEEGIMHALQKLDAFEDLVLRVEAQASVASTAAKVIPEHNATTPVRAAMEARPSAVDTDTKVIAEPSIPPVVEKEEVESEVESKSIDELSMEELEAATAPTPPPAQPALAAQPVENELDIF